MTLPARGEGAAQAQAFEQITEAQELSGQLRDMAKSVEQSGKAVDDHFSMRSMALGFIALHIFDIIFQNILDDSPGLGIVIGILVIPIIFIIGFIWVCIVLMTFHARKWRLGLSRMLGPVAGIAIVLIMAHVDFPPWRVRFEALRPYYLGKIWMLADADKGKPIEFIWYDKELWSGHQKHVIIYSKNFKPAKCVENGFVHYTNLRMGFHAINIYTDYSHSCQME